MSKHSQRQCSAYDTGRKIGQRIYSHYKPADRTEFNQAFRKLYNGNKAFYPTAFAAACHAYSNCKQLRKNPNAIL
jgi:hypothetical protein